MITELSDLFTYSSHKREITFTQDVSGRGVCAYPFLGTDEKKKWLYGPEKFPGLSRNGPQLRQNSRHTSTKTSTQRPSNIRERTMGTMSENNLRRITLARGPIWGIHSLTSIISCLTQTTLHTINRGNICEN